MKQTHIVVIGGGMAGTAAANTLIKLGHKVSIVEKSYHLGGRICSAQEGDFTFELGAGFITDIYKHTFQFLKQTGLDQRLTQRKSKSAIIKNNKLYRVSLSTLLGNSFLPLHTKAGLLSEILKVFPAWQSLTGENIWKAYPYDTQSVQDAFKDNKETLAYLIEPLLDGYFYWSSENTSEATLLFILKAGIERGKTSILTSGLQRIPEMAAKGCEILPLHEVKRVTKLPHNKYEIITNRKTLKADGIVCATTATAVTKIFKDLTDKQRTFFSNIHYSSTVVVAKTYKDKLIPNHYAIAYPRKEKYDLGTITITSDKVTKTTLVKLFASGVSGSKLCLESDQKIEKILMKDTIISRGIFDFSLPSDGTHIQRWTEALPEFNTGHFNRLKEFMEGNIELQNERIVFAGDYLGGPFIEGAFTSGIQAAKRLHQRLQ